jgi:hypothetical protein
MTEEDAQRWLVETLGVSRETVCIQPYRPVLHKGGNTLEGPNTLVGEVGTLGSGGGVPLCFT